MILSQHPLDDKLLLGRYRVVRLLGEGGMGTVHLARVEGAEGFTRPVVVKRMRREIRATDEGNRLFIREAKILSRLQHPAIVGISDFGIEDGAHIMVLEYVHGYTLAPWLEYRRQLGRPLPVDVSLFIVRRVLDALDYAHHFGTSEGQEIEIVHRDVSPDNILLSNRGFVHLLDFGVASIRGPEADNSTQAGVFRGKLGYAAPETIQGHEASPRSDQYSAAVVLFELLTHETLFVAESMGETVVRMVNELPPPASSRREGIAPGLDQVLARVLAKDPLQRFDSALAFARALRPFQQRDDDEVAQELQALVRADFVALPQRLQVEALEARNEALAKIRSIPTQGGVHIRDTHPAPVPAGALLPADDPVSPAAPPVASVPAPAAAPPSLQRQLRGLLWALLVVGALLALGLGATASFLARAGGSQEQRVVVVGGERSASGPAPGMRADPGASDPTASEVATKLPPDPSSLPPTLPADRAGTEAPARAEEHRAPSVRPHSSGPQKPTAASASQAEGQGLQQQLARAVQQQSAAYQNCFTVHLPAGDSGAVLHFSVAKAGGAAQVNVEPPRVAATPLGHCLEQAGQQVRFPALANEVSFRVPVRARVTRQPEPQ